MQAHQNLIKFLPYKNHSFQVKKSNWSVSAQHKLISDIFGDCEILVINRHDLFSTSYDIKRFILMTLMWGYPTKGRGTNIEKLLTGVNFHNLCQMLIRYRDADVSIIDLKKEVQEIKGLGISTITKFLYFLRTTIEGDRTLILDNRIMSVINSGLYEPYESLQGINPSNAINLYPTYLSITQQLSEDLQVQPDQIEMFLFTFGNNLSK